MPVLKNTVPDPTQNFSFWNDSRILCDLQLDETTQAKLDKEKEKNVKAIIYCRVYSIALSLVPLVAYIQSSQLPQQ